MLILDPGHYYGLMNLDAPPEHWSQLVFVKRVGDKYPGNTEAHAGTTTQEVLRALIDRTKYVDKQEPHEVNNIVLGFLRASIFQLERRAAYRHKRHEAFLQLTYRNFTDGVLIEDLPYCNLCGHIGCPGNCRDENKEKEDPAKTIGQHVKYNYEGIKGNREL